ncbi:AMP-binding protein [Ruixingdingia sedimenti]|uniref:AMP-binding protein n=1 Tax=Ruixingdingia sedimenti TaxID=3073604 RepID=A0ABU1F2V9_9RHOB|nr:AMP-binding protein [Xinfangfangia sp. LG-4]MDR5651202.1 AMP-binding protein [Xinfangfangia sp. LG-4]
MNLFHLLDQAATRFPDHGAVYLGADRVATYAELRLRSLRLAAGLQRDCAPGARIAVFSENCPQYVELMFGIWAGSMVFAPINAKLHPKEAVQILEDSGAEIAFVSAKLARGLAPELPGSGAAACRLVVVGSPDHEAILAPEPLVHVASDPEALAWLFFTSGTTGRSKGAMLSHRNMMAMTVAHLADMDSADETNSLLHAAPMSHGSGLYMPAYVARGARQVVPVSGGFDPEEFMDLCGIHPGVAVFFAPTMVQRLRVHAETTGRRPQNLQTVIYGGGPMYLEEIRKSLKIFGNVFVQIFGQGEAPMTITGLRRRDYEGADDALLGSVGYPRSGVQVAVVDPDGTPLPPGEVGEVICRGDVVMGGYWNNPKATAEALRGGWLYTGDMGSMDERGCLTLRDRSKDVIISGGTNIYPREVEEALLKHPGVAEVCIVGQKHAEWGEIVVAVVVPEPGAAVEPADLDAHCNAHIARFKRPKKYIFAESLPKSNYGKVLKRELREQLPPIEA